MLKTLPPLVLPQNSNNNSIDYYLQPLTFRVSNDTLAGPSTSKFDKNLKKFSKKFNKKILLEYRNNILWVWDFSAVTEWKNDIVIRKNFSKIQTKKLKKNLNTITNSREYLLTQDERLKRCRVGSSLVKGLLKPAFETETDIVFNVPSNLYKKKVDPNKSIQDILNTNIFNTDPEQSDIIDMKINTSIDVNDQEDTSSWKQSKLIVQPDSHLEETQTTIDNDFYQNTSLLDTSSLEPHARKLGNFYKEVVDSKMPFLNTKDSSSNDDFYNSSMDLLNGQSTLFLNSEQLTLTKGKSKFLSLSDSNEDSFVEELSEEESNFIGKFGTIQQLKDCIPLIDTKLAKDFPNIISVHVKLRSWSDIVRISRLQKQRDWEKYILSRERDRDCILGQSKQLAEVCDRAMKSAVDWRSDRIMGNTLVDLKKKKSLWQGPASVFREKMDAHNRRKDFFNFMAKSCEESSQFDQKSIFSRKDISKTKLIWALFLLREYMVAGWNVDERLFFHFCEVFGYNIHLDIRLMFFFDRFQRQANVNPQQLKEYRQSIEDGRRTIYLKKNLNISKENIQEFTPLKERAHKNFLEALGEDVFMTSLPKLQY